MRYSPNVWIGSQFAVESFTNNKNERHDILREELDCQGRWNEVQSEQLQT